MPMWAAIWTDLASATRTSFLVAPTWPELALELRRWIEADLTALDRIAASDRPARRFSPVDRARTYRARIRHHLDQGDVMGAVAQLVEYRSGELAVNYGPAIRCGNQSLQPAAGPSAS